VDTASEPSLDATIAVEEVAAVLEEENQDAEETVEDAEETVEDTDVDETVDVGEDEPDLEPLDVELQPLNDTASPPPTEAIPDDTNSPPSSPEPVYEDPSDSDDGEGEWITPGNVGLHKSRAMDLLPEKATKGKGKQKDDEVIDAGCMTADFAMQNVLLHMGLNLVGVEGKRIQRIKSWVLRCHACFKCVFFLR
jgi:RNA-binding protein NOB1